MPSNPPPSSRPRKRIVSGTLWTLLLAACLLASSLLVPWSLQMARWVEWELVLVAWWSWGAVVLGYLLYKGWRVSDDHRYKNAGWLDRLSTMDTLGSIGDFSVGESGCGEVIFGIIVCGLVIVAAMFVVECVLPALFFVIYQLLQRALARVANDHHGCEGRLARASLWGAVWSAVYTLPLAALIWTVHHLAGKN